MPEDETDSTPITLALESMAHGGDAVARYRGQVVFVRGGIPGERVRARITDHRKSFLRANVVDVLEPSADRVTPPCPYAARCGGCQWQHIAYPRQVSLKTDIIRETLSRIGGTSEPPVQPMIPASSPLGYRNHIQVRQTYDGRLGLQERESHHVVPIDRCLLAHPRVDGLWQDLADLRMPFRRASLRAGIHTGETLGVLESARRPDPDALPGDSWVWMHRDEPQVLQGQPWYHEKVAGRRYRVSASSFFQVNTRQAEELVRLVLEGLAPGPRDSVLDIYSGVGVFALQLTERAQRVLGIEADGPAVADARVNTTDRGNISWRIGPAEHVLPELGGHWNKAILDPPRAGCAPQVIDALVRLGVERIAYVSCEPSTLARDIKRMSSLGYRLVHVQPVDMFPQTFHIESVSLIERDRR
ncbi:MAG: class I SAM-dependent RNA methyltransferase [Anaerolineae bacterium]